MPFSKMEKKTEPVIFFFYQRGGVQPCRQVEGTSKYMVLSPRSFLPSTFLSSPLSCLFSTQLFIYKYLLFLNYIFGPLGLCDD